MPNDQEGWNNMTTGKLVLDHNQEKYEEHEEKLESEVLKAIREKKEYKKCC